MTPEQEMYERFLQDPSNYLLGLVYYNQADPRIIVPRRVRWMGWTLNFARPISWVFMIIILAPVVLVMPLACVTSFIQGALGH